MVLSIGVSINFWNSITIPLCLVTTPCQQTPKTIWNLAGTIDNGRNKETLYLIYEDRIWKDNGPLPHLWPSCSSIGSLKYEVSNYQSWKLGEKYYTAINKLSPEKWKNNVPMQKGQRLHFFLLGSHQCISAQHDVHQKYHQWVSLIIFTVFLRLVWKFQSPYASQQRCLTLYAFYGWFRLLQSVTSQ